MIVQGKRSVHPWMMGAIIVAATVSASAQTLRHFPIPPRYTDNKVLNHLQALDGQIKVLRKSTFKVSFYGWSSQDVGAAAEKTWGATSALMQARSR